MSDAMKKFLSTDKPKGKTKSDNYDAAVADLLSALKEGDSGRAGKALKAALIEHSLDDS